MAKEEPKPPETIDDWMDLLEKEMRASTYLSDRTRAKAVLAGLMSENQARHKRYYMWALKQPQPVVDAVIEGRARITIISRNSKIEPHESRAAMMISAETHDAAVYLPHLNAYQLSVLCIDRPITEF